VKTAHDVLYRYGKFLIEHLHTLLCIGKIT